jgi:hypothetical protein
MSNSVLHRPARRIFPVAALGVVSAFSAHAATVTFQQGFSPDSDYKSSDTMIRGDDGNAVNNYGAGGYNIVGRVPNGPLRTLFTYSIASIPSDAIITSVTLTIIGERNDTTSTNASTLFNLHKLNGSFVEGNGTLTGTANAGANWTSRGDGVAWTTPGGDFDSTVLSSISVNSRSADEKGYTFNSTPELVAAAQNALSNGGDLSFLMKLNDASEASTSRNVFFFYGDDAAGTNNVDADKRPILTITYIPEPSVIASVALGGLLLLGRRQRK